VRMYVIAASAEVAERVRQDLVIPALPGT
jgi:hypothetical protein